MPLIDGVRCAASDRNSKCRRVGLSHLILLNRLADGGSTNGHRSSVLPVRTRSTWCATARLGDSADPPTERATAVSPQGTEDLGTDEQDAHCQHGQENDVARWESPHERMVSDIT